MKKSIKRPDNEVATKDLFLASFLLTSGGEIKDMVLTSDKRGGQALFVITGAAVGELEKEYANGKAKVNVRELKEKLKTVKDIMFDRIRSRDFYGNGRHKEQSNEIFRRLHQTA